MMQQTIWAPDNGSGSPWTVTQDYTYDAVNRLATSAEELSSVTQWSRTYSYDHFGNRWLSGATGHTLYMATPNASTDVDAATNRLSYAQTGAVYDNAGNLTAHPYITPGSGSMAYDANNKMTSFTATGVSVATKYDAAGRRVRKIYNGKATIWVYDAFGKLAAEYTMETQTDEATYFRTTDHLGSTRLTTDEVGDVVARRDYFPFGERIDSTLSGRGSVVDGTLAPFNSSPGMRQQFIGQQRDEETGLDYFWARNTHAALGRFTSVDPGSAGSRKFHPQSWNAYSYALNSPLRFRDPDGRQSCEGNDGDPTECDDLSSYAEYADSEECGGSGGNIEDLLKGPEHKVEVNGDSEPDPEPEPERTPSTIGMFGDLGSTDSGGGLPSAYVNWAIVATAVGKATEFPEESRLPRSFRTLRARPCGCAPKHNSSGWR